MNVIQVPIVDLIISRFNSRKTRPADQVVKLAERIERNGFEATRALWVVKRDKYEVFAGGTRLLAAQKAGLAAIPCVVHDIGDEDIARLEALDNENDEYHAPVPQPDVWAECHRLAKDENWTQDRIAKAKGWDRPTVALRISLHGCLAVHGPVREGLLDEGHAIPVLGVEVGHPTLMDWLTTDQAQRELVEQVLGRHRGSSVGLKPTVKNVRETATTWKEMIATAEEAAADLGPDFVKALVKSEARSVGAVQRVASEFRRKKADEAKEKADESEKATELVNKIVLGDAARLVAESAPSGIKLLLTDPPYGVAFQGNQRRTTPKKAVLVSDDGIDAAIELLSSVLKVTVPKMADDSVAFIFTGWRHEPEFRACITAAGLSVRQSIVWVKNNSGSGGLTTHFAPQHERIIYAVKGNPKLTGKRPADVLYGKDKQNSEHPTEKPVDLLAQLVEATTERGDLVVDPFAGSGSSLVAALGLGRDAWGCEIDKDYHRLAESRLLALATKDAA